MLREVEEEGYIMEGSLDLTIEGNLYHLDHQPAGLLNEKREFVEK
ncbi:MAG: hypothetical protein ABJF89_07650 [Parasphingorhabdus sp.]